MLRWFASIFGIHPTKSLADVLCFDMHSVDQQERTRHLRPYLPREIIHHRFGHLTLWRAYMNCNVVRSRLHRPCGFTGELHWYFVLWRTHFKIVEYLHMVLHHITRGSQGLSEIQCHGISNRSILTRSSECGPQHFVRHNCNRSRSSSYAGAFYFKISPSAELASGV